MAQPLICDAADGELAAFMVTKLDDGDTLALCPGHMVDWARTMLDAVAPADALDSSPEVGAGAPFPSDGADGAGDGTGDGQDAGASHPGPGPDDDSDEDEVADVAAGVNGASRPKHPARKASPKVPATGH